MLFEVRLLCKIYVSECWAPYDFSYEEALSCLDHSFDANIHVEILNVLVIGAGQCIEQGPPAGTHIRLLLMVRSERVERISVFLTAGKCGNFQDRDSDKRGEAEFTSCGCWSSTRKQHPNMEIGY